MSLIAIIPARTGSKRLPNKNHLPFAGSTLAHRAVDCARQSGIFDAVWVTADAEADKYLTIPFTRLHIAYAPIHIDDQIETASLVFDLLASIHYRCDEFCVLNPTSPLRTPKLLIKLYDLFQRGRDPCLMTYFNGKHDGTAIFCKTLDFLRCPDFHQLPKFMYFMKPGESIDINTRADFEQAERMYIEAVSSR